MGALGPEALRQLAFLAGAAGEGELTDGFGGAEVRGRAELGSDVAEDAALECRMQVCKAGQVQGDAFCRGAATAADGPAGEDELRGDAGQLSGPPGFLAASQFGHLRQVLAQARIPGVERGQQLVADAVAGVGKAAVGGVFAPGLGEGVEVLLDLGTGNGEQRANDGSLGGFQRGMDAGQAFRPCAAQEFGDYGFGLVVEGVGGGDGIEGSAGEELAEPRVAQAAGGLFDGLGGLAGAGGGFGGGIDARGVKGQTELLGEVADEGQIGVGFLSAQTMVQMGDVQGEAKFPALLMEGAEESDGVCAAGDGYGEAHAGTQEGGIEREMRRICGHATIIRRLPRLDSPL